MSTARQCDEVATSFEAFRQRFPGTDSMTYFDVAARGLMSRDTRAAIDAYLDESLFRGGDKAQMFETLERARSRFAALINASPDEVAITKNVSEGLNAVGIALPWAAGDEIVMCSTLEHPNNVYPWRHVARQKDAVIKDVPDEDGRLPVERMAEAVGPSTRLVVAATSTFAPGYRCNLDALSAACRAHDALLLVDAVQSVGVLHTDVQAMGVDALAVSTQKGLLALYGFGFLYCKKSWAQRLEPAYLARFSVDLGDAHEASLGGTDYVLAPGALRFDLGNYNYIGAYAADASMAQLAALGTQAIEAHVSSLCHQIVAGLQALDLPFALSESNASLGNIVSVGSIGAGQHDTADDADLVDLDRHLRANGVKHSIRRGQLRFALHAYNDQSDVDALVGLCREWKHVVSR